MLHRSSQLCRSPRIETNELAERHVGARSLAVAAGRAFVAFALDGR